jgi:hypothetical protein
MSSRWVNYGPCETHRPATCACESAWGIQISGTLGCVVRSLSGRQPDPFNNRNYETMMPVLAMPFCNPARRMEAGRSDTLPTWSGLPDPIRRNPAFLQHCHRTDRPCQQQPVWRAPIACWPSRQSSGGQSSGRSCRPTGAIAILEDIRKLARSRYLTAALGMNVRRSGAQPLSRGANYRIGGKREHQR